MKTNMKKVLSILLVLILAMALGACSKKDDGNGVVDDLKNGVGDVVDGVEDGVNNMLGNGNDANGTNNTATVDGLTIKMYENDANLSSYSKTHELGEAGGAYTVVLTSDKDISNFLVFNGVEGVLDMRDNSIQETKINKGEAVVLHLDRNEDVTVSMDVDGTAKGYTIRVSGGKLDVRAAAEGWQNNINLNGDNAGVQGGNNGGLLTDGNRNGNGNGNGNSTGSNPGITQ